MAFNLVQDTDLDRLADAYAQVYCHRPADLHPLAPDYLVVQTAGMKKWLTLETARRCGSFCAVETLNPVQFIMKLGVLVLNTRERRTIFEKDILPWALYRILEADLESGVPGLEPLAGYSQQGEEGPSLRLYSLASALADLYDQYMLSRPQWLALWEKGKTIASLHTSFPVRPEEAWQAHIWRRLIECGGDTSSRVDYFDRLGNILEKGSAQAHLPKRVCIFGMSLLPPRFLRIFAQLGNCCDVNLFLQVPSIYYTGDLRDDKTIKRIEMSQSKAKGRTPQAIEQLRHTGGNRLLANLGKTGREFMDLILDENPVEIDRDQHCEPEESLDTSLLNTLQRDICTCENPRSTPLTVSEKQWSIRIARCTGALREVEILHDVLLESLRDLPDLSPSEILVVTPDIETYAPLIDQVFGAGKERCGVEIKYCIANRSRLSENRTLRLATDLIGAVSSRFTLAEIVPLFEEYRDMCGEPLDKSERAILRERCTNAGIRWGLNKAFKERLGVAGDNTLTWESGLDRLFAGFAISGNEPLDNGILPACSYDGQGSELLGALSRFVETLGELANLTGQTLDWSAWVVRVRPLLALVLPGDSAQPDDSLPDPLLGAFEKIGERITVAGLDTLELSWEHFSRVLCDELALPDPDGRFLTGALTVADMVPMRSIPFRVIALIGMNRGNFPRHAMQPEFDLMRHERCKGDRDTLAADQYLFLELLLAARDRLIITTSGRTDKGNHPPMSSSVELLVNELNREYTLQDSPAGNAVMVSYPLQPGSARYRSSAPGDIALLTFNAVWFTAPPERRPPENLFCWQATQVPDESTGVTMVDGQILCRALKNPAEWFFRIACKVYSHREDEDLPDSELFSLDNLSGWKVRDELVKAFCTNDALACSRIQAQGKIPPGPPGQFVLQVEQKAVEGRLAKLNELFPDPHFEHKTYHCVRDTVLFKFRAFLYATENRVVLLDSGKIKAHRRIAHWVTHLFENLEKPIETTLVCLDKTIALPPVPASRAQALLLDLAALVNECGSSFLPLFPEAAWKYCVTEKPEEKLTEAWKEIEKLLGRGYNQSFSEDSWVKQAFGEACSFADVGIEDAFRELSVRLFGDLAGVYK